MSNLTAEALSQFWFSEWYSVSNGLEGGIKEWIRSYGFDANTPLASSDKFQLSYLAEKNPLRSLAFDCNRFSMAAIETFYGLNRARPNVLRNSTPWLFIESYYAAFYSAHALLRLFGKSCTVLEYSETNAIKDIVSIYHPLSPIAKGGYYTITVDTAAQLVNFARTTKRPHQQLWNELNDFLTYVVASLASGSTRYQTALLQLQSLQKNLNSNGASGGIWLSSIREEINYKHGRAAWYPYTGVRRAEVERMVRSVSVMPTDSLSIDLDCHGQNDLIRYLNTTNYLILLCCEIFQHIEERSVVKVFPSDGPLKLLNLLAA